MTPQINANGVSRIAHSFLATPQEIIEEARNGRIFILVDDEDRENEGDLVIPAQMTTPDVINFMAKYGRGLICLAMTKSRVDQLGLSLMTSVNRAPHETAFTVSIEAREGVTTGISAADRACTVAAAIDGARGPEAIVTPGHIFPLVARDGGVLVRAGHTEAAVDVARLAGLNPSGVICEIMNEDGTMARLQDLKAFAQRHALKIGTIRDLIAYRRRHDRLLERRTERRFESVWGGAWTAITFRNKGTGDEELALVKGRIDPSEPTLVRMHHLDHFSDMLGEVGDRTDLLRSAMQAIGDEGRGVVVIINHQRSSFNKLSDSRDKRGSAPGAEVIEFRDYGVGAQILADLDVHEIITLTNTPHMPVALAGHGLSILGVRPLAGSQRPK